MPEVAVTDRFPRNPPPETPDPKLPAVHEVSTGDPAGRREFRVSGCGSLLTCSLARSPRDLSVEQPRHRDVLVDVREMNAHPTADQLPHASLLVGRGVEPRKPADGGGNLPPIGQYNAQHPVFNAHVDRAGPDSSGRNTHTNVPRKLPG